MLIFLDIWTKAIFSKRSQQNVHYPGMLMFMVIWTQIDLFEIISKNEIFLKMVIYFDIWSKKIFSKGNAKSSNIDILADMGGLLGYIYDYYTDIWANNNFIKMIAKNVLYPKMLILRRYGQKDGFSK